MNENIDNLIDELCERYNFCGCGAVERGYSALYNILNLMQMWHDEKRDKFSTTCLYTKYTSLIEQYIKENPRDVFDLILYFADALTMTVHGGSILSSWPKDDDLLKKLKIIAGYSEGKWANEK